MTTKTETWHDRLATLITEKGMTLSEIGDAIGVSAASVHGYKEKKVKNIAHDIFLRICLYFEVSPFWLHTGEGLQKLEISGNGEIITPMVVNTMLPKGSIPKAVLSAMQLEMVADLSEADRSFVNAYLGSNDLGRDMALLLLQRNIDNERCKNRDEIIEKFNQFKSLTSN